MKPYRNQSGKSGVVAYEAGSSWIRLKFARGGIYRYDAAMLGSAAVEKMKRLAERGRGLTTFVNTHPEIKNGYTR